MLGFSPLASAPLGGDIVEEDAGGVISLTASSITTSAPLVDPVVINVEYPFVASDILTGNPDIVDAVASLNRVLAVANLDTGPPLVGDASGMAVSSVLSTVDVTTSAPSVESSGISQDHVTACGDVDTASASVDTVAMSEDQTFSVLDVVTGSVSLGATELQEVDPAPSMNAGFSEVYYQDRFVYSQFANSGTFDIASDSSQYRSIAPTGIGAITETSSSWAFYIFWKDSDLQYSSHYYYRRLVTVNKATGGTLATLGSAEYLGTNTNHANYLPISGNWANVVGVHIRESSTDVWSWEYGTYLSGDIENLAISPVRGSYLSGTGVSTKSVLDSRIVIYTLRENNGGSVNTAFVNDTIKLTVFDNGIVDRPDPITNIVASPLTGSPVVDNPEINTINNFNVQDDFTASAPIVDTATALVQYNFTSSADLITLAADVPTANMAEYETFTTASISTQAPSVPAQLLGQLCILSSGDIETVAPSVAVVDLSISSEFTTSDISTGSVSVGDADATIIYNIEDVVTGSVDVETIAFQQLHLLGSLDVFSGEIRVNSTGIVENNTLATADLFTGNPVVAILSLIEAQPLVADSVNTGSPIVISSVLTQIHDVLATSISTNNPVVNSSGINQNEYLVAEPLVTGEPDVNGPLVVPIHIDLLNVLLGTPQVDNALLSEEESFSTEDVYFGQPEIGQAEMIFSRDAGMGNSQNSVVLVASLNLLSLTSDGRNVVQ